MFYFQGVCLRSSVIWLADPSVMLLKGRARLRSYDLSHSLTITKVIRKLSSRRNKRTHTLSNSATNATRKCTVDLGLYQSQGTAMYTITTLGLSWGCTVCLTVCVRQTDERWRECSRTLATLASQHLMRQTRESTFHHQAMISRAAQRRNRRPLNSMWHCPG